MRKRITITHLRDAADWLNQITDSPTEPISRKRWNVGHYMIAQAYGGYALQRVSTPSGAVTSPVSHGYMPARELLEKINAYGWGYNEANIKGRES